MVVDVKAESGFAALCCTLLPHSSIHRDYDSANALSITLVALSYKMPVEAAKQLEWKRAKGRLPRLTPT
jgi:hypothetical protein